MNEQAITVLIVEDSRTDSTLLARMLPRSFRVTHAYSMAEAETLLTNAARPFDIIVSDLNLPDSSGLQTCSRLRAHAPRSAIVVISGTSDEELAAEAVRQGAQDYLVKGRFDATSLRTEITHALERHRLQTALEKSEQHYRRLLEAITDYMYRVTLKEGHVVKTEHSPACAAVTGYTAEQYAGNDQLWLEMVYPEDQAAVLEQARRVRAGESAPPLEHRVVHADGSLRWVRNTVVPHFDENGILLGYDGLIRDISQRKAAEEQLTRSEAFYHSLVETLPQHIIRKDLKERFTFANHHFCDLVGKPLGELVGKTDFDLFAPELARKYQEDDRKVIRTGVALEIVEENQAPGGEKRYVNVVKTPIFDLHGRTIGIQGIFWDITEKKRAEEQLHRANEELRRSHAELKAAQLQLIQAAKMESIGTLAAGVAHEVKNPLATLAMGVNYLERNLGDEDKNLTMVVTEMREAIARADKVTRELLDFAASRQLETRRENVNSLLEQTLVLLRHKLNEQRIDLVTRFAPDLPDVAVEKRQIQQVFINILMNAVQALEGGGSIVITTACKRLTQVQFAEGSRSSDQFYVGDQVVVTTFDDSGPGIPRENLAKIFDPFFTTKPTGIGTGLGLPVSKKIVELHRGTIEVSNRPDGGARVSVTLHAEKPYEKESTAGR